MKTKPVLTIVVVTGVLGLIATVYCYWLMDNPLSYRWVPVVLTAFLLATFVFIISLITSVVLVMNCVNQPGAPNPPGQPNDAMSRSNR